MKVLGIETSTPVCSVALLDDGVVVAQYTLALGVHHSEKLFPMIQQVLADGGVTAQNLDGVAVASGPGSFTGLRIGMASAKGLCASAGLPLAVVSTLAGLALGCGCEGLPVCPMLDARRGEVYAGVYELDGGIPRAVMDDCAGPIDAVLADLPHPVVLAGDGAWAHKMHIMQARSDGVLFANQALGRPEAGAVALIGQTLIGRGETADVDAAEPRYLRRSQAERVRDARLAGEQA